MSDAVQCRACGFAPAALVPVRSACEGKVPETAHLTCLACFSCDGCGKGYKENAVPGLALESGETACVECADAVPTCSYCGYATFCEDVVSECTGCGEVACFECAEAIAREERQCACELVRC